MHVCNKSIARLSHCCDRTGLWFVDLNKNLGKTYLPSLNGRKRLALSDAAAAVPDTLPAATWNAVISYTTELSEMCMMRERRIYSYPPMTTYTALHAPYYTYA